MRFLTELSTTVSSRSEVLPGSPEEPCMMHSEMFHPGGRKEAAFMHKFQSPVVKVCPLGCEYSVLSELCWRQDD